MTIQSEWLSGRFYRTDWDISLCPEPTNLCVVAISVSDSSLHFALCRHLTGNWRRLEVDLPLPGNYSWSPSRRDGGWGLLYPHSRRSVSTKITHFFFWSRSGPLTTGLVFSVYTHSQYKLVPLSFHTIWCTCFTLYVVFLLTGPKSTDLRG